MAVRDKTILSEDIQQYGHTVHQTHMVFRILFSLR